MLTEVSPERRRKRIEMIVKMLILLVAGFIVAPLVFVAVKGLIGLAIAALIGVVLVQFAPVVAASVANWRLKMLKAEAARNPIETLQNDYGRRMEALEKFRESIKTFSGEVQTFNAILDGFKQKYPSEANRFDEQLKKLKRLLELRKAKYQEATVSLQAYEQEIQKTKAIWEIGQAAEHTSRAAGMTEGDFLAKIMTDTAIDSVQRSMNSAFAELEISLLDEDRERAKQIYAAKYQGGSLPEPTEHSKLLNIPQDSSLGIDVEPLDIAKLVQSGGRK